MFDALIVLGKNIGVGWTREKIRKTPHFLSDRSELSVFAAGFLFKTGNFNKIIFSGGKTAGVEFPSEAAAMKEFILKKFPEIPENKIILEENSFDTIENAIEVKKIIKNLGLNQLIGLTTNEFAGRAKMVFKKEGLNLDFFKVNDELKKLSPQTYQKFKYKTNPLEILWEKWAYLVILTPLVNNLAHHIIRKMRSKS